MLAIGTFRYHADLATGWVATNQVLRRGGPIIVGRIPDQDPHPHTTFDKLAQGKNWNRQSHGGEVFATLVGGCANLTSVTAIVVNHNRFRVLFMDESGAEVLPLVESVLQVAMRECLGLRPQKVENVDDLFGDDDPDDLDS